MKKRLFSAALLLSACSSPESAEQKRLMDTIEARVQLPFGAHPLSAYARYYSSKPNGRVVAIYTRFVSSHLPDHDLPTGRRRWVSDPGHLPNVVGGSCETVNIVFDPATDTLEQPACNGGGGLPPGGS
jgi:hypothetical protein